VKRKKEIQPQMNSDKSKMKEDKTSVFVFKNPCSSVANYSSVRRVFGKN